MNGFEPVHERIHAWTDAGQWDEREYIVRCMDCKYMETRGQRRYCNAHAGGYPEVTLDDFCSWGEREME